LLWLHDGRERLYPEFAPHATFWGGYGSNVIPTPDAMAATLWNNFADTDTVVFAPDNDEAGRRWCANMIARAREAAQQAGRTLKLYVLEWRSAPEGGDLADLFDRSLRPTADGLGYVMDPDADPWAELDVWRAAEWLEAHGFSAPEQEHKPEPETEQEPATPALAEWLRKVKTFAELKQMAREKPREWLPVLGMDGIISVGDIVLVVGSPKSGKTEFVVRTVSEWEFPVLYCTEEAPEKWAQRLEKLPSRYDTENVHVVSVPMATGEEWVKRLREAAAAGYRGIVIDTVRAQVYYRDENDNKEAQITVGAIAAAARELGLTVLFTQHRNKYGGREQGTAGANALDGIMDVIIRLEHDNRGNANRRVLYANGRVMDPVERVIEWANGELSVVGDAGAVVHREIEAMVLEACTEEWETCEQIRERCRVQNAVAPSERRVREALKRLTDMGELECRESPERSGSGRLPKQYRRRQLFEPADAPPEIPKAVQNYLNELEEGW